MRHSLSLATISLLLSAGVASAASVSPISYDMVNGNSGSLNYWDDSYTGAGVTTVDGAPLSGGLGDLTDGVIATQNWNFVEGPRGPNGPYVGWSNTNPVITFNFAAITDFASATFHFDDSNGFGGVEAPASVTAGGSTQAVIGPVGAAALAFVFDLTGFASTDTLEITIGRATSWVFLSEVTFESASVSTVPIPATGVLLLGGLGGLGAWRRRKGQAA